MIVQSAREGEPHFVITMAEHTNFAGQLARAFGNDAFEAVEPRDVMLYIIDNHDAGWADLDQKADLDRKTGLPFNLVQTPFDEIVKTSAQSPDFNSRRHAYCGLLSSMHSWGLYNGRYGMSDRVLLNTLAEANRATADGMLDGELARQEQLKAELAADPETAAWVEESHLFQNYKQLQFFDTMALHFNCTHEGARPDTVFEHVPQSADKDADISVRLVEEGVYSLAPFPFAEDGFEPSFAGRYLAPVPENGESGLNAIDRSKQTVRLVAG